MWCLGDDANGIVDEDGKRRANSNHHRDFETPDNNTTFCLSIISPLVLKSITRLLQTQLVLPILIPRLDISAEPLLSWDFNSLNLSEPWNRKVYQVHMD